MLLARTAEEISRTARAWRDAGERVGLVPTMGNLHEGHLSLVRTALAEADRVVVSIFVNPNQFGEGEDLDSYPRTPEDDIAALRGLGVDAVFLPTAEVVYPRGYSTWVEVEGLTEVLCGAHRPGHFRGVTTVCAILFGIVRPHLAVFGRKDAQQLAVIRRMTEDLRMGVEVVAAPVVREPDGLATSSRNGYLSPDERRQAAAIYAGLAEARRLASKGETDPRRLAAAVRESVGRQCLLRLQYVELVDPDTMEPMDVLDRPGLLAAAVFAGETRLIDNVILKPPVKKRESGR
jgi:pantoate--beta-alanine ligase